MRIVSWNCNGRFREKFQYLSFLDADIYVIQECENPADSSSLEYRDFAHNYLWIGDNKNKGLGVFARKGLVLKENSLEKYCLRHFLSVRVNDCFDLVAVWACRPYIEEYYIYQNINIRNYNQKTIIIGDFNSNIIWDKKHYARTHSAVVQELNNIGLCSAYHYQSGEPQGKETVPTFYLYRHNDKPYHIDHCFISPNNIRDYQILQNSDWINISDHIPILLETQ